MSREGRYLTSITTYSRGVSYESSQETVVRPATVDEAVAYIQRQRVIAHWRKLKNHMIGASLIFGTLGAFFGALYPNAPDADPVLLYSHSALIGAIATVGVVLFLTYLCFLIGTPGPRLSDRLWARAILAYYRGDEEAYEDLRQQAEDHDAAARAFVIGMLFLTS